MNKCTIAVLSAALFTACASPPRNLTLVERGPKPDIKPALLLVHSILKRSLKDYDSIKDFSVVQNDLYPISATNLAYDFEEAWMLCVEYNAKNSYGGYVGLKSHGFPMRLNPDGTIYLVSTTNWRTNANGSCD